MPTTDTTEAGLETLIVRHLTGSDGLHAAEAADHASGALAEPPGAVAQALAGGSGWIAGRPADYDRGFALDVVQLFAFLHATQPEPVKKLGIADYRKSSYAERQKFLARISTELGKRGVINVLRKGIDHGPVVTLLKDDTQFFKQFFENESFRRFVTDRVRDLNRAA